MEMGDFMNINVLSTNIDQVKYFYIHCWETPWNSVTANVYSAQLSSKCTTNKLIELSKLVDFLCSGVTIDENFKPQCRDSLRIIKWI